MSEITLIELARRRAENKREDRQGYDANLFELLADRIEALEAQLAAIRSLGQEGLG